MDSEWILLDDSNRLRLSEAGSQKEAIREALRRGIRPSNTNQVRPRVARWDSDNRLMSTSELMDYIEEITQ